MNDGNLAVFADEERCRHGLDLGCLNQALLRGASKDRADYWARLHAIGVYSANEIRALEDMNPREDGKGGQFYDPPNTAGGEKPGKEIGNEPSEAA